MNIEKFIKDDLEIRVTMNNDMFLELNLEDICRGLGFVDLSKGTNKIIWNRVEKYICDITATQVSPYNRGGYIPEWVFYMLCMKAKNDKAKSFQLWVCKDVLPSLRKNSYYIDVKNINNDQVDNLINEAIEIKRQRDNLENGIRFNKKFKCDLKNYLENLYPNIEDVYEQFIENMKLGKMLDDKGVPTDRFMEYNQRYNMFEHITKVSDKINIRLRLTNIGYINLAKRIYEKDGKIYLNKNYEREE